MGVSTDAVLFYGYCWDDEVRLFPDGEWTHVVARKRGHASPWDAFPQELEDPAHPGYVRDYAARTAAVASWRDTHRAELDAWYELLRAIETEFGVELHYHCSHECPMPYLRVRGSGRTARRGYPVELDPVNDLDVPRDEHRERLDRWLAEVGVERPHPEPQWWLVSFWG